MARHTFSIQREIKDEREDEQVIAKVIQYDG